MAVLMTSAVTVRTATKVAVISVTKVVVMTAMKHAVMVVTKEEVRTREVNVSARMRAWSNTPTGIS